MMNISLAIITYNEEINIGNCLKAAASVVDEIVVVDSASTDKTVEIAESFGAKVIQRPFSNFVDQKNFALEQCSHDWVLSLDADEVLSETLRNSILAVKSAPVADGYLMDRLTNYCGQWIYHCGWYPDTKLRLFKKSISRWEGHLIHEKIGMLAGSSQTKLTGDLLHYSYYHIDDHIRQAVKFSGISAQEQFELGKKAGLHKIILSPFVKFVRDYVFRLGFLDGFYGFVICKISAHATFLKYARLHHLHRLQNNSSK